MPRRLGQHFLVRDSILEHIARETCGESVPRVVEIGPGRGALTRHLLPRTEELHAVELDAKLVEVLGEKFAGAEHLTVHHADVLETDLSQWGPAAIVGNLPYYITSPIIEKFLALDDSFPRAVFLMQWEVAERLLSTPGHRTYGYLSVATQLVCEVGLVCKVPPSAFSPPPKVESAAVRLLRKPDAPRERADLLRFVGRCFTHKRKTLRNNLLAVYGERIAAMPEAGLRAEQLSILQFIDLFARLANSAEPDLSVH